MEETPSCPAQHIVSPPHPHPTLPASTQASTHPHQLPPLPAGTRSPSRRSTCLSSQHPGPSSWACSEPCVSPRRGGPEPLSRVCCPRASSIVPTARRGLCHYCPLSWGPQGWGEGTQAGAGLLRRDPTLLRLCPSSQTLFLPGPAFRGTFILSKSVIDGSNLILGHPKPYLLGLLNSCVSSHCFRLETQKSVWCWEQLCAHRFHNLFEMSQFLERHHQPKLNRRRNDLNRLIHINELESIINKLSNGFTGEVYQTFKEEIVSAPFQRLEAEGILCNSPYEASIAPVPKARALHERKTTDQSLS